MPFPPFSSAAVLQTDTAHPIPPLLALVWQEDAHSEALPYRNCSLGFPYKNQGVENSNNSAIF